MATQVFITPRGPMLFSRINAGALEHGDFVASEEGDRFYLVSTPRRLRTGGVVLTFESWTRTPVRLRLNTPVWRAIGARAGGIIC